MMREEVEREGGRMMEERTNEDVRCKKERKK
jgi:hypothetical protein